MPTYNISCVEVTTIDPTGKIHLVTEITKGDECSCILEDGTKVVRMNESTFVIEDTCVKLRRLTA